MMFCNTLAGVLMFGVHFLALDVLVEADYGLFVALLGILTLMMSATPGIQTVFTHETAAAASEQERRRLSYYAYGVIKLTFVLWLVFVGGIAVFHRSVFAFYKMDQAWPLIITLVAGLFVVWLPDPSFKFSSTTAAIAVVVDAA